MSNVAEIEQAIAKLPREGFFRLVSTLRERFQDEWDRSMEEDAQAGRLDPFGSKPKQRVMPGHWMKSCTTESFGSTLQL